jgi:hypothetical protein
MKIILAIVLILGIITVLNSAIRKSDKLDAPANKAVSALATCARYFIYGAMAFLGFAFAMYIGRDFFGL